MDEKLISLDEAAARLGVDTKELRGYLRKHRPKGAVQVPQKPGGSWHVSASLLLQLEVAGAPGLESDLKPIDDDVLESVEWSEWIPFGQAAEKAPVAPGVYMFRRAGHADNAPVYIGQAGERSGKGLRGRLKIYSNGNAAAFGMGKYAFDQALADPQWLQQLAREAESGNPETIQQVARRAIDRLELEARWVICVHRKAALLLEAALVKKHEATLWNARAAAQESRA